MGDVSTDLDDLAADLDARDERRRQEVEVPAAQKCVDESHPGIADTNNDFLGAWLRRIDLSDPKDLGGRKR